MELTEIRRAGVTIQVPSAEIGGKTVVVTGRWLKIASIKDEEYQEGEIVPPPQQLLANLQSCRGLKADLFTFSQKPNETNPQYPFFYEWNSVAAIRVTSFSDWWENRVSRKLRQDIKRAERLGVAVKATDFSDDFVRDIMAIYDETPIRQGRPFWHYKKDFAAVKLETSTFLKRSDFIGAYLGDELIGFLKIVYVNKLAYFLAIISKDAHRDRRPTNALIAKAVELCGTKGCSHLIFGRYQYRQGPDGVTAFKQRNGFEEILVPKYYVPLTIRGRVMLHLRLHRGAKALVPPPILRSLKRIRAYIYHHLFPTHKAT